MKKSKEEINCQTIRNLTQQQWQIRWTSIARDLWTLKLTADVVAWIQKKHGETNYYRTQLLSGHGYIQKYRVAHIRRTHVFFLKINRKPLTSNIPTRRSQAASNRANAVDSPNHHFSTSNDLETISSENRLLCDLCAVVRRLVETRTVAYAFDE